MIYIFAALHSEVKTIISNYELKKCESVVGSFVQFKNDDILLTLTGTGPVRVAVAVGAVLGKESNGKWGEEPITLLVGSAAFSSSKTDLIQIGDICLINKLTNMDSGRTFYPDMIIKTDIPEASIITGSRLLDTRDDLFDSGLAGDSNCAETHEVSETFQMDELYDMEAAAFYEASAEFTSPDKIHVLKMVSDMGEASAVTRESLEDQFALQYDTIQKYVDILLRKESLEYDNCNEVLWKTADKLAAKVAIDGKFSVTMENELRQILKYAVLVEDDNAEKAESSEKSEMVKLAKPEEVAEISEIPGMGKTASGHCSNIGIVEIINGLYRDEKLPARDKRSGKEILNELRKYVR